MSFNSAGGGTGGGPSMITGTISGAAKASRPLRSKAYRISFITLFESRAAVDRREKRHRSDQCFHRSLPQSVHLALRSTNPERSRYENAITFALSSKPLNGPAKHKK